MIKGLIILILVLLSSIALAQIPDIGESGCVPAPGLPCDDSVGPAFADKPDCYTPDYTRDCNGECLVPGDMVWYDNDCIDECNAEVRADIARFEECLYDTPTQTTPTQEWVEPEWEDYEEPEEEPEPIEPPTPYDEDIDQEEVDKGLKELDVDKSLEQGLEYDIKTILLRDPKKAKNEARLKYKLEQAKKDMLRLRSLRDSLYEAESHLNEGPDNPRLIYERDQAFTAFGIALANQQYLYQQILKLDKNNPQANYGMSSILKYRKKYSEAEVFYRRALATKDEAQLAIIIEDQKKLAKNTMPGNNLFMDELRQQFKGRIGPISLEHLGKAEKVEKLNLYQRLKTRVHYYYDEQSKGLMEDLVFQ